MRKLEMISSAKFKNCQELNDLAKKRGIHALGTGITGNKHGKKSLCEAVLNKSYELETKKLHN